MVTPVNEFMGFDVFVPTTRPGSSQIQMTVTKTGARLSKAAMGYLKYPEYVNVFFNRGTKQMMITAADKRNQNILKLSKKKNYSNTLSQKCLIQELFSIIGDEKPTLCLGKKTKYSSPAIIFDLSMKAGS